MCSLVQRLWSERASRSVWRLQAEANRVVADADDIGGVVTDRTVPEAGVWVIAETSDLPTSTQDRRDGWQRAA